MQEDAEAQQAEADIHEEAARKTLQPGRIDASHGDQDGIGRNLVVASAGGAIVSSRARNDDRDGEDFIGPILEGGGRPDPGGVELVRY